MTRTGRILTAAGALLAAGALAVAALAAARHDAARAAWREAARVGARGYDAARSDALYQGVLEHRAQAERAAWIAALGIALACAGLGARTRSIGGEPAPLRAWAALAIDALAIALASWLLFAITRALGADHAGFAALVAISGGAIVLASSWSALAAGRTLGARVARVRFAHGDRAPGLARAAAALALAPLAIASSPIALPLSLRARAAPPSLRWVGLEALLDAPRASE